MGPCTSRSSPPSGRSLRTHPGLSLVIQGQPGDDGGISALKTTTRLCQLIIRAPQWLKQAPQVYRPGPPAPVLREVGWPSQTWDTPMQEALVVRREAHIPAPPAAVSRLLNRSGETSALDGYGGAGRAALRWDLLLCIPEKRQGQNHLSGFILYDHHQSRIVVWALFSQLQDCALGMRKCRQNIRQVRTGRNHLSGHAELRCRGRRYRPIAANRACRSGSNQ